MFQKGQKVVCINGEFPPLAHEMYDRLPKQDSVYTIRAIYIGRGNFTKAESGQKDGEIGVLLEEIRNPSDPALRSGLNGELGFNSERFAPLHYNTDDAERTEEQEDKDLVPV